jgi:hypothetical protein
MGNLILSEEAVSAALWYFFGAVWRHSVMMRLSVVPEKDNCPMRLLTEVALYSSCRFITSIVKSGPTSLTDGPVSRPHPLHAAFGKRTEAFCPAQLFGSGRS